MLDFCARKYKPHCKRPNRALFTFVLLICCMLSLMLQVSGIPTGRRNTDSTHIDDMPIQSLDDYANSGKLYHVERIKRMMESFDDVILKRFFRAALARLEDEDEPDEEEEENIYQQQIPPPSTLNDEPIASTSQAILQNSEIPDDSNSATPKNGQRRVPRSLSRGQSIRVELWPHHRRRRKGCPAVKDKVQFLCPTKNHHLYDVCISREQLCDHVNDCPNNEDEDEKFCLFYKPLCCYWLTMLSDKTNLE